MGTQDLVRRATVSAPATLGGPAAGARRNEALQPIHFRYQFFHIALRGYVVVGHEEFHHGIKLIELAFFSACGSP